MSVDSRLRYLWQTQLGDAKPPPQQEDGTVDQQQPAQWSSNSSQDVSAATIGVPISPQGPQPPRQKKKTGNQGRDCRDRWRLGAEIATSIIGAIGLGALIVTLDQGRKATEAALQSAAIARKQMELAERPWISAEATLTDPVVFYDYGYAFMRVRTSLKNVGHSVATDIWVSTRVVLVVHGDGKLESLTEPERERNTLCEWVREEANPREGGHALFPEQQVASVGEIPLGREYIEARAFEERGAVGKFIDPVVVGCVAYRDTFTSDRHVTGFAYLVRSLISPNGFFRVGETVPVEKIQLTSAYLVGAYID